jgi:hypothetical protein
LFAYFLAFASKCGYATHCFSSVGLNVSLKVQFPQLTPFPQTVSFPSQKICRALIHLPPKHLYKHELRVHFWRFPKEAAAAKDSTL